MTSASLCSSNETLRELSDNGKKQCKQLIDIQEDSSFNAQKKPKFQGCGLLGTAVQCKTWPSHTLKNNFIAWYYALWMVKVLENVFRGIICSFAVNNWSNLWRYWNQMFALFPPPYLCSSGGAQIWGLHSEPYKFLLHILKKNSAAENWTDVRLGQVVNLSIFYNI